MPYIGRGPSKSGAFRILKDFSASFDGSATSFAIQDTNGTALSIATPQNLMIAVDGVLQEPGSAYTISGTNIVFSAAPQDSATFWGVELGDIGATSVSSSDQILVVATGHSFVVGRWMKTTSTDSVYAYADCTTEANAEVAGIIISTTTDAYTLQVHGTVTGDSVPALASGSIMFLDDSNGQMTVTETSTVGEVSKPLAIVTKNSSEMVILTYRGEVISSNIQTNAPNDATYLTTTANGTLTAEVVVGSAPGGELGGTWASPTVDGTHSGSAHHADAHTVASHSDTTATGAELETLTDGSTTALHAHAVHHVEAHTVASHSDTTGTGAEVETLTDGSNAESLHTHTHTVVSHSDTTATGAELETLTDGSTTALHVHTIADDSIVEAKLDVSNGPTNGQFLQAQSGEGGGLTWAAAGGTTHTTGTTNVHVVNDATTGVTLNNDYKFTMVMPSSGEGFFFKCADQGSEQSALYYADYPSQITKIAGSSKWSVLNGGQTGSSSDGKFYVVSDANSRTITIFNREGNNRTITVHGMGRLASVTAQVAI